MLLCQINFFIKFKQIKNGSSSAIISTLTQLPLTVPANEQFDLTIVSENLFYVVYINDEIAFTNRIYKNESKSMDNFANNGEVPFSDLTVSN